MSKQILNVGTRNNDKTGDTLRAGGLKIKANFDELYNALATDGSTISGGDLLKTGSWSDVRNKPLFKAIATTASFYDLENRPDLVTATGAPSTFVGLEGNTAGQIAFDGNNLYVAIADYDGTTDIWKQIPWDSGVGILNTGDITPGSLDLTKGVNKLTDGNYTLADGVEGQILYVVLKTGTVDPAAVKITVPGKCRIQGSEYTNNFINPFAAGSNMVQFMFTDGAWQTIGGMWD